MLSSSEVRWRMGQVTPYEFEVPYMSDAASLSPKFGIDMFRDILMVARR